MAEMEIEQDGFGLNKAARLRAEFAERQRVEAPPELEPDFPYKVLGFDAVFFGVDG